MHDVYCLISFVVVYRRGGSVVERSPCMPEIGVRFPITTDMSLKTESESSSDKLSITGASVTGPRRVPL